MKKFKVDKNTSKKIVAFALIGTMTAGMLTGCSSNKSLLDGTILEDTRVVSFDDGHKDIASVYDSCRGTYHHYKSIVTDERFAAKDCTQQEINFHKYDITSDESIISYLTPEEIVKASKGELTEDDIANIINRIFTKEEEQNSVQKVK